MAVTIIQSFKILGEGIGKENFVFETLEFVQNLDHLIAYEQSYLDYFKRLPSGVFNFGDRCENPRKRQKITEEHKRRISLAMKGKKKTQEHRDRIAQSLVDYYWKT